MAFSTELSEAWAGGVTGFTGLGARAGGGSSAELAESICIGGKVRWLRWPSRSFTGGALRLAGEGGRRDAGETTESKVSTGVVGGAPRLARTSTRRRQAARAQRAKTRREGAVGIR